MRKVRRTEMQSQCMQCAGKNRLGMRYGACKHGGSMPHCLKTQHTYTYTSLRMYSHWLAPYCYDLYIINLVFHRFIGAVHQTCKIKTATSGATATSVALNRIPAECGIYIRQVSLPVYFTCFATCELITM